MTSLAVAEPSRALASGRDERETAARLTASSADIRLLNATMLHGQSWPRYEEIVSDQESELDGVIAKPWGHEYRVYGDPFFDVWRLSIDPGRSTSEHCHPRKSTALICLLGSGRLRLLSGIHTVGRSDIVHIGRGVFHATENISSEPLTLVEVETPRNKLDLVRARDPYGRAATPYNDPLSDALVAPPMLEAPLVSNARYRRTCASGRSRFEIVFGYSILAHRDPSLCAVLSLAVGDAVNANITILHAGEISPHAIDKRGAYLAIFHSR